MLSFSCPKCGGTTKFDETKEVPTYCMFCGAHLPDMTDFVKESLRLGLDKKQLDLDRERHNMEMEEMKRQIRRNYSRNSLPPSKVFLCTLMLIFLIILLITTRH